MNTWLYFIKFQVLIKSNFYLLFNEFEMVFLELILLLLKMVVFYFFTLSESKYPKLYFTNLGHTWWLFVLNLFTRFVCTFSNLVGRKILCSQLFVFLIIFSNMCNVDIGFLSISGYRDASKCFNSFNWLMINTKFMVFKNDKE